jgi:hypothetical protein
MTEEEVGRAATTQPEKGAATPDPDLPPAPVTAWSSSQGVEVDPAALSSRNPAEWAYKRLCRLIHEFESKLTDGEEVGATIVGAPGEGSFHVDDIGYWGPDLILFYGKNGHGRPIRLIQHYSQLDVVLTAMPRVTEPEPRRIGFQLVDRIEKAAGKVADAPAPQSPTSSPT